MLALLQVPRAMQVVILLVQDVIAFKLSLLSELGLLPPVPLPQLPIIHYNVCLHSSLSLTKMQRDQQLRMFWAATSVADAEMLMVLEVFSQLKTSSPRKNWANAADDDH